MLGVTDARGVDRPAGLVMPLTSCLSHPFHPPPTKTKNTILNKMLGNAPIHCVSVCKCMCALGRSCQDLFICNTCVDVEALRFLNVGILVDCIGASSRGGHGRREARTWRNADATDESCKDFQGVDDLRVVMFPINHILHGNPKEIEIAYRELMFIIDRLAPGQGDQR